MKLDLTMTGLQSNNIEIDEGIITCNELIATEDVLTVNLGINNNISVSNSVAISNHLLVGKGLVVDNGNIKNAMIENITIENDCFIKGDIFHTNKILAYFYFSNNRMIPLFSSVYDTTQLYSSFNLQESLDVTGNDTYILLMPQTKILFFTDDFLLYNLENKTTQPIYTLIVFNNSSFCNKILLFSINLSYNSIIV